MSHLYLLVDSTGAGFKIGVSIDPLQRIAALPEKIDVGKSFQIKFADEGAYRVEKILHRLFQKFHLEKDRGAGYTEWFSIECFDAVQDFIRSQRNLLDWTHFEPIPEQKTSFTPTSYIRRHRISNEERIKLKSEKIRNALMDCYEENHRAVHAFSFWITLLRNQRVLVGKFYIQNMSGRGIVIAVLGMEYDPPQRLGISTYSGSFSFIDSYVSRGKYAFLSLTDTNCFSEYVYGDKGYLPHDELMQTAFEIINGIEFVAEPILSDVLEHYEKSWRQ